ncbi:hypothetical protein [Roseivirga sp. E12]|uniref:PglD-related sugar-binding protein n=1 Tax=Roseivirga sp. E12 TaxID=2819237 RepID=UPI001ABC374C|nr:hypothetical protein [Roseivirga sp. E12]MBO3699765.1 hypothetical protein [Roseivirga sp. E12]
MKTTTNLVIIGSGYAYWEVYDLILDINQSGRENFNIVGIVDDNESLWGEVFNGVKVIGPLEKVEEYATDVKFVMAIGSHKTLSLRHNLIKRLRLDSSRFQTLIHPSAKVFSTASVGNGCIIHYGSVVFSFATLKPFVIISANCVIAVENLIGQGAMLGSNITLTTGVKIGAYAFIGSSTTIAENVEIGPCAKIGMTSNVFRKIKPGMTIFGNPSKYLGAVPVQEEILEIWEQNKIN